VVLYRSGRNGKEVNLITGLDLRIGPGLDLALRAHSIYADKYMHTTFEHAAVHANTNMERE
jgi:hypothetical protein